MAKESSALKIETTERGLIVALRVQPKASAERIGGTHGHALKIAVTAPPDKGKANEAVIRLVAKTLGIAPSSVELLSGHTGKDKRILLPPTVSRDKIDALATQNPA